MALTTDIPPEIIRALPTLQWPKKGQVSVVGIPIHQLKGSIDWCQGCDGLWKPWSMGWTELGLYRCYECRNSECTKEKN
ncbi:hypothetical protein [Mycobacterium phage C3]|nr:hypothetical protein [Mycobacterium phage C3]